MQYPYLHHSGDGQVTSFTSQSLPATLPDPAELASEVCAAAQRGWQIFPVFSHSKYAMGAAAMIGRATSDFDQLAAWARQYPNWAVALGQASGVLALELVGAAGTKSYSDFVMDNLDDELMAQSLMSQAGCGDSATMYAYFRWPAGFAMRHLRRDLAPGLRLRGENDYVMIPPSIRLNCARHFYINPDAEVLATPPWLVDLAFVSEADARSAPAKFPPSCADPKTSDACRNPSCG